MMNKGIGMVLSLCVMGLSACAMDDGDANYVPANYPTYTYDNSILYPSSDYNTPNINYRNYSSDNTVAVPESYHVGQYHSPVSFKDRDKAWASSQNPQSYTIEVAEGDKAAQVAQRLYKAPKTDRSAQLKYQNRGKIYYKGVYGSYPDATSAQKALDSLPSDMKAAAKIKNWSSVQSDME